MFGGTQKERAKKEKKNSKAVAKKAGMKVKKLEAQRVEATATSRAEGLEMGSEPVNAVADWVQQVTLSSSSGSLGLSGCEVVRERMLHVRMCLP